MIIEPVAVHRPVCEVEVAHRERLRSERIGWLRAAIFGANDSGHRASRLRAGAARASLRYLSPGSHVECQATNQIDGLATAFRLHPLSSREELRP